MLLPAVVTGMQHLQLLHRRLQADVVSAMEHVAAVVSIATGTQCACQQSHAHSDLCIGGRVQRRRHIMCGKSWQSSACRPSKPAVYLC